MPANRTHSNPHWHPKPDIRPRTAITPAKAGKFRFNSIEGLADYIEQEHANIPDVDVYDPAFRRGIALDIAQTLFRPKHLKGKSDARKVLQAYLDTSAIENAPQPSAPETPTPVEAVAAGAPLTVYVGFSEYPDGSKEAFSSAPLLAPVPA